MGGYRPFPNVAAKNLVQERLEVPVLIRALGIPRGKRMLEVGCGRGVALPSVARLCTPSRLAGVDIDPELLSEAAQRLAETGTEAEVVSADVRALPFADASFEVVLDFGTVYHITGAELALGEIARVLVPGGVFVHETPLAQLTAHPIRALGHTVPWEAEPALRPGRRAGLWAARVKRSSA